MVRLATISQPANKTRLTFAINFRRARISGRTNTRVRSGRVHALRVEAAHIRLGRALVHVVTRLIRVARITVGAATAERAVQIVTSSV